MPRRTDLRHVLVIGSGPIVIGQACEFDYSGTQACRVLRAEGLQVSLVNSNPATIMTDPEYADHTYVEPITPGFVEKVIAQQAERGNKIDALLATLGGQTALNTAVALYENGALERYGVELIGADFEAIQRGEDRQRFKDIVAKVGGESARSRVCFTMDEVRETVAELGLPVVVRPSFTMGGLGSGMAHTAEEVDRMAGAGLAASPSANVLIEESIYGWKEFELELMRDGNDNVVVVCSIENVDPMGVHTGDSVTVAPAMTLTDREYQRMRDLGIAHPARGRRRHRRLQHPVRGRPARRPADRHRDEPAGVAVQRPGIQGHRLPDRQDRRQTGHRLHPRRDPQRHHQGNPGLLRTDAGLCRGQGAAVRVREIPRRRHDADHHNEIRRRSNVVGPQLHRGARQGDAVAGDQSRRVLDGHRTPERAQTMSTTCWSGCAHPTEGRLYDVELALRLGSFGGTGCRGLRRRPVVRRADRRARGVAARAESTPPCSTPTCCGGASTAACRTARSRRCDRNWPARTVCARCGGGSASTRCTRPWTPAPPSSRPRRRITTAATSSIPSAETEVAPQTEKPKVLILGSGPNRIGQGIEFDYSCVHAATTLSQAGFETVMVNCNPETVSTDYDTADRLYFEPLTFEDVLEVFYAEELSAEVTGGPGVVGVIVQLGGQTPLGLAQRLADAGVPIVGTPPEAIDLAEDRGAFGDVLAAAGLPAPRFGMATTFAQARRIAAEIGYPVLVRPSYVLGGRGMEIVYDEDTLQGYITRATELSPEHPVLVDRFLEDAIEIDVDALCDGAEVYIGGIMEHIEEAGIHSGDSACALPPVTLGRSDIEKVRRATEAIAHGIGVVGLLNVQYALKDDVLYVLEANPRASRTVPFVSKATAVPLAKACARIMLGHQHLSAAQARACWSDRVTAPTRRLQRADRRQGGRAAVPPVPQRRRLGRGLAAGTGDEIDRRGDGHRPRLRHRVRQEPDRGLRIVAEPRARCSYRWPTGTSGRWCFPVKRLADLGFRVLATEGTAEMLRRNGIPCDEVRKHFEPAQPGTPGGLGRRRDPRR